MATEKPNILMFMVDQLTSFVLKSYGGTVCQTTNIDKLAERGTVFENAYCNYPLCSPSRASMMTGRMPSKVGAYDNGAELPAAVPTFAHYLRLNGYYTCISGKMHFVGPDQLHGFEERLTTEIYPADMSWTPVPQKPLDSNQASDGHTFGVSTVDTIRDAGPVARSMQIDYDEDVVGQAIREFYAYARGDDERPFTMTVSLTHPHDPYVITKDIWDMYSDEGIDPPRAPFMPVEDRDPHSQSLYYHYGMDKTEVTDGEYRNARRGYYGMITFVDQLFGKLMAALEACGYDENTVIIFTSDHGDMIGERGMWFKKTLFDPAVRVPIIIAHPDHEGRRVATPASLIDLFPTFLDLAGIDPDDVPTELDGQSLLPGLRGEDQPRPIFVEHLDGGTPAPRFAIRDGDKKLVCSEAYAPQLYNMADDPLELNDLAGTGDPDEERLLKLAQEKWDFQTLHTAIIRSQTERRLVDEALGVGRVESWDFEQRPLQRNQTYMRRGEDFPVAEQVRYLRCK